MIEYKIHTQSIAIRGIPMPFHHTLIIISILLAGLRSSIGLVASTSTSTSKRTTSTPQVGVGSIVVAPIDVHVPSTNFNSQQQDDPLPILTPDLMDLATLRYDEWITDDSENETNDDPPPPSKRAFAMATAEIAQERSQLGAVPFLAKLCLPQTTNNNHHHSKPIPVGASELSPCEFEGALSSESSAMLQNRRHRWYVTDVVTSSQHRRMGIANRLMDCMEKYAYDCHHSNNSTTTRSTASSTTLYLHVKQDNHGALQFYQRPQRGYAVPTETELEGLDCQKLAENARTQGQLLLCKTLTLENLPCLEEPFIETTATATKTAATGFGTFGNTNPTAKKKKKTKRKRK